MVASWVTCLPRRRVDLEEGIGGEERYAEEKSASLVLVEDVDDSISIRPSSGCTFAFDELGDLLFALVNLISPSSVKMLVNAEALLLSVCLCRLRG